MAEDEVLQGRVDRPVVRTGATVTHPVQPWTPAIHELLNYLEEAGFPYSPRVLGIADGTEILSYIDGDSGPEGWARVVNEDGLRAPARLLRAYHDIVTEWKPDHDPVWFTGQVGTGAAGEIVCHGHRPANQPSPNTCNARHRHRDDHCRQAQSTDTAPCRPCCHAALRSTPRLCMIERNAPAHEHEQSSIAGLVTGSASGPRTATVDSTRSLLHHLSMELDKELSGADGASPIEFRLDPGSGVPTYLQIVQQVEHALRLGYLIPGDRLPKVKEVVASLAINPNTVLKAYRELEHKGLAAGRPGQGTFIEGTLDVVPLRHQQALKRGLTRWLAQAVDAGLDEEGITALVASALHDLRRQRKGATA